MEANLTRVGRVGRLDGGFHDHIDNVELAPGRLIGSFTK
jgi:hypothetical protein